MSGLLDKVYINYLSARLERFRWIRSTVAVCKCPFCGDGRKGNRTRFYIYEDIKHSTYRYNCDCKNCGHSESFQSFLKDFDSSLYDEYRREMFREKYGRDKRESSDKEDIPKLGTNVPKIRKTSVDLFGCISINDLPEDHSCRVYVKSRMIPSDFWNKLYYTNDFKSLVANFVDEEYAKKMPDDARLVIPFFNQYGEVECLQGRSLDPKSNMRYISVKKDDSVEKVFGLDRIDRSKTVYVCEGPIDSMFIPNCLAAADADLMRIKGDVYIFDRQYRNADVVSHIKRAIDAGVRLVLFPDDIPYKDINDMVTKGGLSMNDIKELIKNNTFSGLRAKLKFGTLCKVKDNNGKQIFRRSG